MVAVASLAMFFYDLPPDPSLVLTNVRDGLAFRENQGAHFLASLQKISVKEDGRELV